MARRYAGPDRYLLGDYRDLAHQERLTATARDARPVLEVVGPDEIPAELAAAAGVPVAVVARGPGRGDREPTSAGERLIGMTALTGVGTDL